MSFLLTGNNSMDTLVVKKVYQSLTIVATILYSSVFLSAYIQLWLILPLRHKLISTQTIYFLLCCLFTSLRIILFSFFFRDIPSAQNLPKFWYWFLMCLPVVLQYLIVLLITVFYYKTYIKSKGQSPKLKRQIKVFIVSAILIQFLLSLVPIWFRGCTDLNKRYTKCDIAVTSVHVILTDLIFLGTISTFVYVYKQFPSFPNATLIQEAKKITKTRSIIVSCSCLFGVLAKLIYDLTALFGCAKLVNIRLPSPLLQSDFVMLNHDIKSYIVFGIILFFWEIVPLLSLMILFSIQFPTGFFQKQMMGKSSASTLCSYSRSRSSSSASSNNSKSKFINIPAYGAINAYINAAVPFHRTGDRNSRQTPGSIRAVSPLVNYSYDPTKTQGPIRQLRSPMTSGSYTVQDDSSKVLHIKNKPVASIIPRIGRVMSHRYLERHNSKDGVIESKPSNSRLSTANEE